MKAYVMLDFTINPPTGRDLVLAALSERGFDSFEETDRGLKAYIAEDDWSPNLIKDSFIWQLPDYKISYTTEKLAQINWNEEWERHYDPIWVGEEVYVHAPFHPAQAVKHAIEIQPKMSFGTGHHQTTRLMLRGMLSLALAGQSVLDMGTGTGVLAIMAEQCGAQKITAIDNFEWAVENTRENKERNGCTRIDAVLGDAALLHKQNNSYDLILANINRNVLLEDMGDYVQYLKPGGELLMSGFFKSDAPLIEEKARALGLKPMETWEEQPWVAMLYAKLA